MQKKLITASLAAITLQVNGVRLETEGLFGGALGGLGAAATAAMPVEVTAMDAVTAAIPVEVPGMDTATSALPIAGPGIEQVTQ